ncbi:LPS export ABC transporter periplasmic protein LptC [Falsirhodobacter deserti]|uniref:LPS export ABC transporter periplasmic protein LptC n=1 Tax=Falsirhodobacter deserti TaxID=1365611 RepID=UPI000FE38FDE|nr:LPS export ABC transporter periplasmic protein LptC [Falsirhodobacter deserti]
MAKITDRHTRLVAWLKVILPLAALVMLSTIFLVSRTVNPEDAIPYAEVDVTGRAMDPRLTQPTWSGLTGDGARLNIAAAEARPPAEGRAATITALRADLTTPDGVETRMQAGSGTFDGEAGIIEMSGQVRLHNTLGYDIRLPSLTARTDATRLEGQGPVTATAPMGQLTAGGMVLKTDGETDYRLDFTDGVKLIYTPSN